MIFLVTALIEFSEDIDYVVVVEANTPQQALDYALTHNLVNVNQEVKVINPTIHKAMLHKIKSK